MRSSDFSDPKIPTTTKARGTQASVSAFGGSSGGRSSRNESRMRDIFGVGHMRGGHKQNSQGRGYRSPRRRSERPQQSDVCRRGSLLRGETIDRRARTGRIGGPKIPAGIMELGNSVWEDEGTLHWKLRTANPGRRFRQRPLTSSTTTRSGRGHSGGSRVYHSNASCRMLPRTT